MKRKLKPLHKILEENPDWEIKPVGGVNIVDMGWTYLGLIELTAFGTEVLTQPAEHIGLGVSKVHITKKFNFLAHETWFEPTPEPKKLYAYNFMEDLSQKIWFSEEKLQKDSEGCKYLGEIEIK